MERRPQASLVEGATQPACAGCGDCASDVPVVCGPSPYEATCASNLKSAIDRRLVLDGYQQSLKASIQKLKASGLGHSQAKAQALGVIRLATESAVRERVAEAVETFNRMLQGSSRLTLEQKQALQNIVKGCESGIELQQFPFGRRNGEEVSWLRDRQYSSPEYLERVRRGQVAAQAGMVSCKISLSLDNWMDCAENRPTCFDQLFHELAHSINTCALAAYSDISAKAAADAGDLNYEDSLTKETTLARAAETYGDLARTVLQGNRFCLTAISNPRTAVRSECAAPDFQRFGFPDGYCRNDEMPDFPSQWNEAEADLWAASALAEWLTQKPANRGFQDRRGAMSEIMGGLCLDEKRPINDSFDPPAKDEPPARCSTVSAVPGVNTSRMKSWLAHQSYTLRYDGNYLSNSDLRAALGCSFEQARVPATCSPRDSKFHVMESP